MWEGDTSGMIWMLCQKRCMMHHAWAVLITVIILTYLYYEILLHVYLNYASLPHSGYITSWLPNLGLFYLKKLRQRFLATVLMWCPMAKNWESFCQAALQISRHAAVMLWQKGYDLYVCSHSSEQNKSNCAREQVMKTLTTLNFSFMIWKIHEVILSLFKHNRESSFANCQPWRASAFGLLWRPSSSVHWTVARR